VGEIDGTPYLTMAYLEGRSLAQLLQGPTRPWRQAVGLVSKVALALQEAHDHGIIHRDLKPSNILINRRGEPVILDFGLARRLCQGGARLTRSGQPLGTPAYMSPEQVAGALQVMGPGCDIFSLGVILYQLLTGRLPFEGPLAEVLGQIVTRRPEPPTRHRPDLDPRLEAICLKALSKEVADRYASMRDFAAALASCVPPERPPAAAPVPILARAAQGGSAWLRQQPGRWVLAAVAGAGALALAGVLLWPAPAAGTVRIKLDDQPGPVEIRVDGKQLDRGALNDAMQLPPGEHHLLIIGPKIEISAAFTVARGDNPILRVKLAPAPDPAANRVPSSPGDNGSTGKVTRPRHRDDDDDDDDHHAPRARERRSTKKGPRPERAREREDDD
jgi:hypothetical protein